MRIESIHEEQFTSFTPNEASPIVGGNVYTRTVIYTATGDSVDLAFDYVYQ